MSRYILVLGYGIPADIFSDENYGLYLKSVFNMVYQTYLKYPTKDLKIIFSGGKTDIRKPYRRTEAGEMIRVFRGLMQRPGLKKHTKNWKLIAEKKALSTLDNFLYAKELIDKHSSLAEEIMVFGEYTRGERLQFLAKQIFNRATVIPIDFDQSTNRYLDPAFLSEKEAKTLAADCWALKNPANLKQHRALLKQKITYLRQAGPENHANAVKMWWEKELRNAMNQEIK